MGGPALRALAKALATVFAVTTLTFFLVRLMPGNPVDVYLDRLVVGQGLSGADASALASALFAIELDQPVHQQYLSYLGNLAHGNLGASVLSQGTPVAALLLRYLPWTLLSVGVGLSLSFGLGVGLGLLMAHRRGSLLDRLLTALASLSSSIPNYLVAAMIVVIFGVQLRWLPIAQMRGAVSPGMTPSLSLDFLGDALFHAALPIATYVVTTIGSWMLLMRSSTLGALEEDYVVAARARGLGERRITAAYVGRNALSPLLAQLAVSAGFVIGGSVLIEFVFVYPGVGLLLFNAVNSRDYPVMQGVFLLVTVAVVCANLVADLAYGALDPRVGRTRGLAQ